MCVFGGAVCEMQVLLLFVRLDLAGWAAAKLEGFWVSPNELCLWIPGKLSGLWEGFSVTENRWGLESYILL